MEGKNTPGPWWMGVNKESGGECFDIRAGGDHGPCVAQWVEPDDASLIAAAPELLEACEMALAFVEGNDLSFLTRWGEVEDALRAAIAKARGKR